MKMNKKSGFLLVSLVLTLVFVMTAFAGCGAKTYTVNFESDGGSNVAEITTDGTKITMPSAPTKDGYIFGGWYYDSELKNEFKAEKLKDNPITSDITLYAKWTAVTMTGLSVKTQPNKKVYTAGETFDKTGMEISASYNDGSSKQITEYTIDKTGALAVSDTKVTITYSIFKTEVSITVNPVPVVLEGITVTGPSTTLYREGEIFDPAGMVVTAQYSDGTYFTVTDYTVDKTTVLTVEDTTVTVSYSGFNESVTIKVAALTGISVTTPPTKLIYAIGETFNAGGMVVTSQYSESSLNQDVTALCEFDTTTGFTGNESSVEISYKQKTTSVPITIIKMTGIAIDTNPDKMVYYEGDLFDPAGMVVSAVYTGADKQMVTGYTVDKTEALTTSDTSVKISYNGFETTLTITVNGLTGIRIDTAPKTSYYEGQSFNTAGMVVKGEYSDGAALPVNGYTVDKTGPLEIGDTSVKISYRGFDATVTITVAVDNRVENKIEAETAFLVNGTPNPDNPGSGQQQIAVTGSGSASDGKRVSGWGNNLNAAAHMVFTSDKETYAVLTMNFGYGDGTPKEINEFLSVTVNGVSVSAPGVFPSSNGWEDHKSVVYAEILLTEGRNVIVFTAISYDTYINFDYISLKTDAVIGEYTETQVTGDSYKFEAEDATEFTGGVFPSGDASQDPMYNSPSGGRYAGGFDTAGRTISFKVNTAADVTATLRVCINRKNTNFSSLMKCTVNGELLLNNAFVPGDAVHYDEWYDWKDFMVANINLTAGDNTIKFEVVNGGFNFDYITIVSPVAVTWA